jgi:hypothetical protein
MGQHDKLLCNLPLKKIKQSICGEGIAGIQCRNYLDIQQCSLRFLSLKGKLATRVLAHAYICLSLRRQSRP